MPPLGTCWWLLVAGMRMEHSLRWRPTAPRLTLGPTWPACQGDWGLEACSSIVTSGGMTFRPLQFWGQSGLGAAVVWVSLGSGSRLSVSANCAAQTSIARSQVCLVPGPWSLESQQRTLLEDPAELRGWGLLFPAAAEGHGGEGADPADDPQAHPAGRSCPGEQPWHPTGLPAPGHAC